MRRKGSRYEGTQPFSEDKGFPGYRERQLTAALGLAEHTLLHTDRLDHLADDYYRSDRRWWRIVDSNPEFLYGFEMLDESRYGTAITIPAAREPRR
ncbi:MAG: hypothetical protein KDI63_15630 [Gammaproteobacteria bacterium]|nr:hypothetical protein [Gammaproteobacteria bacterium]